VYTSPPKTASQAFALLAFVLLSGCEGTPIREETAARRQLAEIGGSYRPDRRIPALPALTPDSPAAEFLRFALLKHPQVEAAYDDWRAAVEAITPARSLPDPQLTAQPNITSGNSLAIMPGLMFDFMTRGKLAAMGREAAAASDVAYREYAAAVMRTAAEARKASIELAYVDEALRLREDSLRAADQSLALAGADYSTGSGPATLEAQVRILNSAGEQRANLAMLRDRRTAARVRFKSALGLGPDDPDPPWPSFPLQATHLPPQEELWGAAERVNPGLAGMRAMVDMAVAGVDVARTSRTPDFSVGAMFDSMARPVPVRPSASVTLPIWRDKIAAVIRGAEAKRDAAVARLDAEQINLAAEIAQMLFMVRESDRMIEYLDGVALPNLERSAASSEAAYQSGLGGAGMIPEARLMALGMRLERADLLRRRETSVADLLLILAAVAPPGAPLLAGTAAPPP